MKVEIYSREAIKELMKGEFPKNTAVSAFAVRAKHAEPRKYGCISGVCAIVYLTF